jgi:hypothetical protein
LPTSVAHLFHSLRLVGLARGHTSTHGWLCAHASLGGIVCTGIAVEPIIKTVVKAAKLLYETH